MGYLIDSNSVSSDTPKKLRFCKDCKYIQHDYLPLETQYICLHSKVSSRFNLVTGNRCLSECKDARSTLGTCGPSGTYFEIKQDAS